MTTYTVSDMSMLVATLLTGLRVGSDHQDRAYSLDEVSERTGFAVTSLMKDCRAGRLNHVHYGDFRGMTPLHIAEMLRRYSTDGDLAIRRVELKNDMAEARAASRKAASRKTPRRAAA
jgi:hypothetical protein